MEKNERLPELLEELKTVLVAKNRKRSGRKKNRQYLEFVQVSIEENEWNDMDWHENRMKLFGKTFRWKFDRQKHGISV